MSRGFLLDTNVPSELTYPAPDAHVKAWVSAHDNLHLSVISVGELQRGFALLPQSKRRTQLEQWFVLNLLPLIGSRILPVTHAIADRWGKLGAQCQLRGAHLHLSDGLIAATALEHDLALVTRNVKDFSGLGLTVINPWKS